MYITDVVKNLLIINVLTFIGSKMLLGEPDAQTMMALINEQGGTLRDFKRYMLAVFFPTSEYFRPYQIVTYMFMHGDVSHIFFNMFALYMFGTPVELAWGPRRFLTFYFITGFGALALQFLVQFIEIEYGMQSPMSANIPMLGASGAVFGILAGYGMQYPDSIIQLIIPPVQMKAKYFVLIYAGLEVILGLSPFQSGVAHFAHVGGALFGFLMVLYWRKKGEIY